MANVLDNIIIRTSATVAGNDVITTGTIGSQSVNYAAGAGNASTLDTLDSSQFLRSDESDTMTGSLTINASGVGLNVSSSQNTGLIVDGGTNSLIIAEFKKGTTKAVINENGGGYFLGSIGIGVTSVATRLDVQTSDAGTGLGDGMILKLKNTSTDNNTRSGIIFGNIEGIGSALAMQSAILKNSATGEYDMTWDLYGGAAGWKEALLYLDSNPGNVGIGTTTPAAGYKLDVNGAIQGLGISSNSVSKSYTWRLDNTGNSGNIWRRICRFDGGQSARIKIEMTGQTGYGSNISFGSVVTIIGQLNNADNLQGSWWVEGYEAAVLAVQFELIAANQYYINVQVGSFAEYAITATISKGILTLSDTTVSGVSNVTRRRWFRSETAFLDASVGIGTTSPQEKLDIQNGKLRFSNNVSGRNSTIGMDDNFNFYIKNTSLGNLHIGNGTTTFVNGTLQASGVIRSQNDVVAYYSSDKQLKDNITPIPNALDKVKAIGGYEFDWNDKQDTHEGHDIGVIAQEVEAVLPEIVTTRENGYKAVKYEKLVAVLIEAIKDQQKQIEELKAIVNGITK